MESSSAEGRSLLDVSRRLRGEATGMGSGVFAGDTFGSRPGYVLMPQAPVRPSRQPASFPAVFGRFFKIIRHCNLLCWTTGS